MERVLVVDDHSQWRALYRLVLRDEYEVREAGDAVEAMETARAWPPDLMVLDYQLPGISGAELLAAMRAEGFIMPVILCTAHPAQARIEDYEAVLSKSTDLRALRRTIEHALAERESRRNPPRAA